MAALIFFSFSDHGHRAVKNSRIIAFQFGRGGRSFLVVHNLVVVATVQKP